MGSQKLHVESAVCHNRPIFINKTAHQAARDGDLCQYCPRGSHGICPAYTAVRLIEEEESLLVGTSRCPATLAPAAGPSPDAAKVERYGQAVWEDPGLDAVRKRSCFCLNCERLKPGDRKASCRIANRLYRLCVEHGLALVIYGCPIWREKR